jgi:hypothetical protein
VGVKAPKPAEAALGDALPLEVGKDDLPGVADADPLHLAFAIDEDPHLPPDVSRDLREMAREILGYQGAGRELPLVELFEPVPLAGLEPDDVSFETVNGQSLLMFVSVTSKSSFARAER